MSRQDNLRNLLFSQRKCVPDIGLYGKLTFEDLKRIDRLIPNDITKSLACCLYTGVKVGNNYCPFSYRGKKTSLLRILYHNLVEDIKLGQRIIYTCENKGSCCNLAHFHMISDEVPEIESEQENSAEEEEIFNPSRIFF